MRNRLRFRQQPLAAHRSLYTFPLVDAILAAPRAEHTTFYDHSISKLDLVAKHTFSIDEIRGLSVRLAEQLENGGLKSGDCVAAFAENSIFTVIATCATWLCGATFVPLSSKYPDDDIDYFLSDSGTTLMLYDDTTKKRVK